MSGNLSYCISLLQDNEESIRKEAQQVLLTLCTNIMKNPKEPRYRKIKLANATISTKLLPALGAIECLFEAGFIESDDGFALPTDASLAGVNELYSLLDNTSQPAHSQSMSHASEDSKKLATSVEQNKPAAKYRKLENTFLLHLMDHFRSVLRYEDKSLQAKVRSILPLEKLQISAMDKLREVQKEMKLKKVSQDDICFEDLLLTELLRWFKFKFFKWVDTLACQNCMGECYNAGSRVSRSPQISRIEIHKCKSCKYENEFPRYTDPEALLYSRRGRCGEWANCFTLICRTIGLDARLVYDETDHVWTEVWSVAHNRWIHADACENVVDQPLIYEKGWGKQLSYVIAFSRDEIQDVTWRYTRNPKEVMTRRKHCSEEALAMFIRKFNEERQTSVGYSNARRKFVLKRCAFELAEMISAPPGQKKPAEMLESDNEADYGGRTSGSMAWRISRGEVATSKYEATQWYIPRGVSRFQLRYDIVSDTYTTVDGGNNKVLETRQRWHKGIEHVDGAIFRKEESDWKMVYLARSPGSESGKITWTLAIKDISQAFVSSLKLQAITTTFSGATVKWQVEGLFRSEEGKTTEEKRVVTVDDCQNFETMDMNGAIKLSVSAILSGGKGDVAWQHAQLFRQSLDDPLNRESSLLIEVVVVTKT